MTALVLSTALYISNNVDCSCAPISEFSFYNHDYSVSNTVFGEIFGFRRFIDVIDSEIQHGSGKIWTRPGTLGFTENVWHHKYGNKKEGILNTRYSFNRISKIYRALDPKFCQKLDQIMFSVLGSIVMINLIVATIITDIEWLNHMSKVNYTANPRSRVQFLEFIPTSYKCAKLLGHTVKNMIFPLIWWFALFKNWSSPALFFFKRKKKNFKEIYKIGHNLTKMQIPWYLNFMVTQKNVRT